MATYAIGDVHGCLATLQQLLIKINFDPKHDTLWFTGDLINRGPSSLSTLRFIKSLHDDNKATVVLGNHDVGLLMIAYGHLHPHPKDTLNEILLAPDCEQLLHWLRHLPLIHYDRHLNFLMVHAGIPPQWSITQACSIANDISLNLQDDNFVSHIKNLIGHKPLNWSPEMDIISQHRYAINSLTRMRFCQQKGQLNLHDKGMNNSEPSLYKPWFEWSNSSFQQTEIIFGHWAALQGHCPVPHIHALDTGCVWGQSLTALCLENKLKMSVPSIS